MRVRRHIAVRVRHLHQVAVAALATGEDDLAARGGVHSFADVTLEIQTAVHFRATAGERVGAHAEGRAEGAIVRHADGRVLQRLQQVLGIAGKAAGVGHGPTGTWRHTARCRVGHAFARLDRHRLDADAARLEVFRHVAHHAFGLAQRRQLGVDFGGREVAQVGHLLAQRGQFLRVGVALHHVAGGHHRQAGAKHHGGRR